MEQSGSFPSSPLLPLRESPSPPSTPSPTSTPVSVPSTTSSPRQQPPNTSAHISIGRCVVGQMSPSSAETETELLAELNNEGAFQIELGRLNEAVSILTSALNVAPREFGGGGNGATRTTTSVPSNPSISDSEGNDSTASGPTESSSAAVTSAAPASVAVTSATSASVATSRRRTRDLGSPSSGSSSSRRRNNHNTNHTDDHHPVKSKTGKPKRSSNRSKSRKPNTCHGKKEQLSIATQSLTEDVYDPYSRSKYFVYEKPIRVKDRYELPSRSELCMYIVYNLALACHLRIVSQRRRKKDMSAVWRRVLKLYELARTIQLQDGVGLEVTHTVALWNNMAMVYRSLSMDDKADICWTNMLSNIVCMIDHGCVRDVERIEEFLQNMSHILSPCPSPFATSA